MSTHFFFEKKVLGTPARGDGEMARLPRLAVLRADTGADPGGGGNFNAGAANDAPPDVCAFIVV